MATPDRDNSADVLQKITKQLARMRVLVVDRHSTARNTLRIILTTLGISAVHNAGTAAEVLRQVKTFSFDLILCDYHLDDGRDGQQLLEELRQKRLISLSTVFIVVTAERTYQNVVSVAELAPDDYLIKPFTADQIQVRLAKAMYRKQFLKPILINLDKGALAEALTACDALLGAEEPFYYDILRFKGEILNTLGRYAEAQVVYKTILDHAVVPWARMGLAVARRGQDDLTEAEILGAALIDDFPEYMAAYDFLAAVREEMGNLNGAQQALQKATERSPNNSLRQRQAGDVAMRNNDLLAAERAYTKVLERNRGSSLRTIDDYTNLTRVMLDRGNTDGARMVTQELRRDWRGNPESELAALVIDSLCADKAGEPSKAKQALDKALSLHASLQTDSRHKSFSDKIAVDLAHACLVSGDETNAQKILTKIAAENHEDRAMIARIQGVFTKTGKEEAGQHLLARVGKEIVELNNRGVLAARSGNLELSVQMLIEAAERVPNLQFLVNASKAIFTLIDRKGWNEENAQRGIRYVLQAHGKDANNPKVISARELYYQVAKKYGIAVVPIGGVQVAGEKTGT